MNAKYIAMIVGILILSYSCHAHAIEQTYTIDMRNGSFDPPTLEVPAGQKIHLNITNNESSETEFESYPLNQEQKIESGKSADIYIGPLEPGEYPVFDDNNPSAKGAVVAK